MRGVLRALLTLCLAGISTAYFMAEKQVTLADDGRLITVDTFAPTVGAALGRHGIEVGPDDVVVPSPRAEVSDRIEVRRARDVVVILNGARSVERVTGRTVDEVLRELSVSPAGASVLPARDSTVSEGEAIVVAQPVSTTVIHDGTSQPVVTNVLTAGSLLRQLGIVLGPHDRVEPSIIASPAAGPISVVRMSEAIETEQQPVAFGKVIEKTDQLDYGTKKLKMAGVPGLREKSYRVLYEDGRVKSRKLVSNKVVSPPKDEVVLQGTRKPTVTTTSNSQTGKASWYRGISGMTAAHKTLPKGTLVKVTNLSNGKTVTVKIVDRGPYVEGWIIDLSEEAFSQVAATSTGVIPVRIDW